MAFKGKMTSLSKVVACLARWSGLLMPIGASIGKMTNLSIFET
jgi:hypothetical protein